MSPLSNQMHPWEKACACNRHSQVSLIRSIACHFKEHAAHEHRYI